MCKQYSSGHDVNRVCPICQERNPEDCRCKYDTARGREKPKCEGCGKEIDPDTCGCGEVIRPGVAHDNHYPIPMGCDCYRAARKGGGT